MKIEHLDGHDRISCMTMRAILVVAAALLLPLPASAEFVLLKEGGSYEGTVAEKGSEYEVTTKSGIIWIEKSSVKRIIKGLEDLTGEADRLVAEATKGYEEAKKKNSEPKEANVVLKKAIEALEKARGMYFDAREIFDGPQYRGIDKSIRDTVQLIKMCRDGLVQESSPTPKPEPPVVNKPPQPAPKEPSPKEPSPKEPAPKEPPSPPLAENPKPNTPLMPSPLIDEIQKLLDEKKVDAAWKKFEEARKVGEETADLEGALAKTTFVHGKELLEDSKKQQGKKGIEYLRKAHQLQPDNIEYTSLLVEALLMLAGLQNTGTNKSIMLTTEVIGMTDDLMKHDAKKADYTFWQAQAYHLRGFFGANKFMWKAKIGQIKDDFNRATDLYSKVLKMSPGGDISREAENAIKTLDVFLEALRTGKTPRKR